MTLRQSETSIWQGPSTHPLATGALAQVPAVFIALGANHRPSHQVEPLYHLPHLRPSLAGLLEDALLQDPLRPPGGASLSSSAPAPWAHSRGSWTTRRCKTCRGVFGNGGRACGSKRGLSPVTADHDESVKTLLKGRALLYTLVSPEEGQLGTPSGPRYQARGPLGDGDGLPSCSRLMH